jgi:hypothetical protein
MNLMLGLWGDERWAGKRSMIDWIVFDLMRSLPEGEELAAVGAIY